MSEHLHPWALLHAQEEPSRRRRSNERGRFDLSLLDIFITAARAAAQQPTGFNLLVLCPDYLIVLTV